MKVVLFCGGMGMRLRDSDQVPKPLVEVGHRPILWHLMKYYAHFGHKDFILCLGHGSYKIKEFFLRYDEWATNDFILAGGSRDVTLLATDIEDWRITFADTGLTTSIGERLRRVQPYLEGEEVFLANYADALTDLDLDTYVESFLARDKVACFLSVPAPYTFHIVQADDEGNVTGLEHVGDSKVRINAGFFVLRREIFDFMEPGEELVIEPFARLIERGELVAVPYDGFWQNMDTFKEKAKLDEIAAAGHPPWQVWSN